MKNSTQFIHRYLPIWPYLAAIVIFFTMQPDAVITIVVSITIAAALALLPFLKSSGTTVPRKLLIYQQLLLWVYIAVFLFYKLVLSEQNRAGDSTTATVMQAAAIILFAALTLFTILFQTSLYQPGRSKAGSPLLKNTAINTILFLAVIVALNFAARLRPFAVDMSAFGSYSLSTQAASLVKKINQPVTITAFYPYFHELRKEIEYLLGDIQNTNPQITYTMANALRERDLAIDKKVDRNGYIVLETTNPEAVDILTREKTRRVSVTNATDLKRLEKDIVSALLALTGKEHVVYFTRAHGEFSSTGMFDELLTSTFQKNITAHGIKTRDLSYSNGLSNEIPEDASAIIIAGAQKPFTKNEQETIQKYLQTGGAILLAINPEFNLNFEWLLKYTGYRFHNKILFSQEYYKPDKTRILLTDYTGHEITSKFSRLEKPARVSMFAGSGYFQQHSENNISELNTDAFIASSSRSWLEVIPDREQDSQQEPSASYKTAIATKPSNTGETTFGRIVAFADADFLTNNNIVIGRNLELAVNSLLWLLEDEQTMGLVPQERFSGRVQMNSSQDNFVFYFLVYIWPLLLTLPGFYYVKRKRSRFHTSADSQ